MTEHDSRAHASSRTPVPEDVVDVLLWRLATDVLAVHRPDADGRCTSMFCEGHVWPCPPVRRAQRALHAARGLPADAPLDDLTPEPAPPYTPPARGYAPAPRADVPERDSADWYNEPPVPEPLTGAPERGTAWRRPPRSRDAARSAA